MKIQVVYHSKYGHLHLMAEAIAKGAKTVAGAEVSLWRVPELVPEDTAKTGRARMIRPAFSRVPFIEPQQLAEADAIIFGTPTRFGNMSAQMRHFLDQTGKLWMDGSLIGKVGSVFTSTATQHGGQESTLLSFHTTLLHHGMMIVGLPYSEQRQMIMSEISGGTPYGASTITALDGSRKPSENELAMARFQGQHVAQITASLVRGRIPTHRVPASNYANYGASA